MFWRTRPTQNELSDFYENSYTETHEQKQTQENNRKYYKSHLIEISNETARPITELSLLDYGSSYPVLIEEALQAGARGYAVDWGADVSRWAAERGFEVIQPSQLDLIPNKSVDVIRFSHVLEHLLDPGDVLEAVLTKLKPDGVVHITQPSFPVLSLDAHSVEIQDAVWPNHLHFFSPLSLKVVLEKLGLSIFRFDTDPLPDASSLSRMKPLVDHEYAKEKLKELSQVRSVFEGQGQYPWFLGQNSNCWARYSKPRRSLWSRWFR